MGGFLVLGILAVLFFIFIIKRWVQEFTALSRDNSLIAQNPLFHIWGEALVVILLAIGFACFDTLDETDSSIAFNIHHVLSLELLSLFSLACFFISKYWPNISPLGNVIAGAGILQGIVLFGVMCYHFGPFLLLGLLLPIPPACAVFAPVFGVMVFTEELYRRHIKFLVENKENSAVYENPILNWLQKILLNSFWENNLFLAFVFVPFFALEEFILILCGQQVDSFYHAFTDSYGFMLSSNLEQFINPNYVPPSHYLCTIGAHGKAGLVKPLRYGVRHGGLVIVNRQLMVANAFECLLEKYTPRLHKKVRRFYDRLDIPVSRWCEKPRIANTIYVLMKPLEYFFVFWIYLCYREPEKHIHRQYLPIENQKAVETK